MGSEGMINPNWHGFFQKQNQTWITLRGQHETKKKEKNKHAISTGDQLPKPVLQSQTISHKLPLIPRSCGTMQSQQPVILPPVRATSPWQLSSAFRDRAAIDSGRSRSELEQSGARAGTQAQLGHLPAGPTGSLGRREGWRAGKGLTLHLIRYVAALKKLSSRALVDWARKRGWFLK